MKSLSIFSRTFYSGNSFCIDGKNGNIRFIRFSLQLQRWSLSNLRQVNFSSYCWWACSCVKLIDLLSFTSTSTNFKSFLSMWFWNKVLDSGISKLCWIYKFKCYYWNSLKHSFSFNIYFLSFCETVLLNPTLHFIRN